MLLLRPQEKKDTLENKLLKKCKIDVKESSHHIIEGDIVILTTFFQPSYEKPILKEQTSKLASYINQKAKATTDNQHFIHNITEFGNVVEYALIAIVKEIQTDLTLKLFVQAN